MVDVMLHNLVTDVVETIGKAADYQEAIDLAKRLGKVPQGFNIAASDKSDEHILLVVRKGTIISGVGPVSSVTPPQPKPKKTPIPPEKLVGAPKNPDAAFAPRHPVPFVPGRLHAETPASLFMGCSIRPLDPLIGHVDIKIEILRERVGEFRVRRDIGDLELLAIAFQGLSIQGQEMVRVVSKPPKMEDGALFRIERVSQQTQLTLLIHFWDGTTRACGLEVFRSATLKEIVDEARTKIDDEPLEEDRVYGMFFEGTEAKPPWIQKKYDLKPKVPTHCSGVIRSKFGEMTVALPLFQKSRWLAIVRDQMPEPPLSVVELADKQFYASYSDDARDYRVRFMTAYEGEEHTVSLLPCWENQVLKIRLAFGREMIPDDSRQSKDDVIYVKSADGSPPDPTFDRTLVYSLGADPAEFQIRVHKGTTTQEVMSEIARIHPGCRPEQILLDESAMANEDPVTDWATTTGTSPLKVRVKVGTPTQWLSAWEPTGIRDLGEIELDGKSFQEV
jgi:hypothetical protein